MKNESFRRSFSMLCAAVGLIVLMGIAVAGQMESTEPRCSWNVWLSMSNPSAGMEFSTLLS